MCSTDSIVARLRNSQPIRLFRRPFNFTAKLSSYYRNSMQLIFECHYKYAHNQSFIFSFYFSLLNNISDIMSGVLFYQLLSCISFLALSFLFVDQAERIDALLILTLQCCAMYVIVCYVYCDLSETMTEKAFEISMITYESLWYVSTPRQREALTLVIVRAQKEFRLKGFGLITCSLPQFLMVNTTIC